MNYTRLLGQSNKIYQKYGDYCISESEPNTCCILCCFCQEEHEDEESFWMHVRKKHHDRAPQLRLMAAPTAVASNRLKRKVSLDCSTSEQEHLEVSPGSPAYVEAEYLDGVDASDAHTMLETDHMTAALFDVETRAANGKEQSSTPSDKLEVESSSMATKSNRNYKLIDIDVVPAQQLAGNGDLIKRLFQQVQRTNSEFRCKIRKLAKAIRLIEYELKKQSMHAQKQHMKIIPDQPLTTRDEVLILDEELHRSKEMRDALREEALSIVVENADVYCRVLWRLIMTDEVSNQFCWRGVVDGDKVIKYPIKDMTTMDVFQAAFREKFPAQTINYFKERTMTYFNKAHERLKRKQLSKLEVAECEGCEILNDGIEFTKAERKRVHGDSEDPDSIDDVFMKLNGSRFK